MKVRHRGKGSSDRKKRPLPPPYKKEQAAPTRKRNYIWDVSGCNLGAWTVQESAALCAAVSVHGAREWRKVAQLVGTRNNKQCCERWHTQLKPELDKRRFTPEEDDLLLEAAEKHGNRWRLISDSMFCGGRTDMQIKNRYWTLMKSPGARSYPAGGSATKLMAAALIPEPEPEQECTRDAYEILESPLEPLELDNILQEIRDDPVPDTTIRETRRSPSPAVMWPHTVAHVLKDHTLLPPPAKTSRSWLTTVCGSPTGITVNFNHHVGFGRVGPFDAVNRALGRTLCDARRDAWDGLPHVEQWRDLLAPLEL